MPLYASDLLRAIGETLAQQNKIHEALLYTRASWEMKQGMEGELPERTCKLRSHVFFFYRFLCDLRLTCRRHIVYFHQLLLHTVIRNLTRLADFHLQLNEPKMAVLALMDALPLLQRAYGFDSRQVESIRKQISLNTNHQRGWEPCRTPFEFGI
jgi:hypothetical protein